MKNIIVLSPNFSEDSLIINNAAIHSSYRTMRFGSWTIPETERENVIAVYGEDLFTTVVADQCGFELLKPNNDWLAHIAYDYTLRNIQYDTFGNIKTSINKFIKPVDFKFFPAGVYKEVSDIQGFKTIDNCIEVFVSDVVDWSIEIRCFIVNRTMVTWSTYIYDGKIHLTNQIKDSEEKGMMDFLSTFLSDSNIKLPKSVVIDIGFIPNKGWALIEANPVWSSGVYACDPIKVIDAIVESCQHKD
ncbi:ATP-grasp domain-containing protein [Winogradskyella sp. 3972H.M.0a.05]|uniref:ATP-grasp domain-containing protein n=1 Tax=Winogradskyella sp. 3972H.M.0a.05 TaxID=2950277 RepID=UPI0033930B81